jgi:hypothetical protein
VRIVDARSGASRTSVPTMALNGAKVNDARVSVDGSRKFSV